MSRLCYLTMTLASILTIGCASSRQFVPFPDQSVRLESPENCRIYAVVQPGIPGSIHAYTVRENGRIIGDASRGTYLCWERRPYPSTTSIEVSWPGVRSKSIAFSVESGKEYYVDVIGWDSKELHNLEPKLVDSVAGKKLLPECRVPSVLHSQGCYYPPELVKRGVRVKQSASSGGEVTDESLMQMVKKQFPTENLDGCYLETDSVHVSMAFAKLTDDSSKLKSYKRDEVFRVMRSTENYKRTITVDLSDSPPQGFSEEKLIQMAKQQLTAEEADTCYLAKDTTRMGQKRTELADGTEKVQSEVVAVYALMRRTED